jgi:hypothetical protein
MNRRLPLLAAAIALPSWVAVIVLLGNVDLQRSVTGRLFLPLDRPIVLLAVGLIAFAVGLVGASIARVRVSHLVALPAWLVAVNLLGSVAATVAVGELEVKDTLTVLVVLSGAGALFLGGLLGAATSARVTSGGASGSGRGPAAQRLRGRRRGAR